MKLIKKFNWDDLHNLNLTVLHVPANPYAGEFTEGVVLFDHINKKGYVIHEKDITVQNERTFPHKDAVYEVAKKQYRTDVCRAAFQKGAMWLKKELLKEGA